MDKINKQLSANTEYVLKMRRHFRMHPEVGGSEHETQKTIMEELRAMGLSPRQIAGTGVVAEITGRPGGKTIALRADIDALPLQDESDQPYRSKNNGTCHACGHDGHIAMLLGTAKTLIGMRGEFTGNIRLMFQPSEEKFPGGAEGMIADGAMEGVTAVAGAHLWQQLPVGTIGIVAGPLMASADEFTITIQGRGGHGSMPQQTIDPILLGAQLVLALRTLTGAYIDTKELVVLTIGMFKAGDVFNIIPDTAVIKGTVRSFDMNVKKAVFERIEAACKGICAMAGATYDLNSFLGYPPVVNNSDVAAVVASAAEEAAGSAGVRSLNPIMVAEDFSYYQGIAPGAFFLVGAGNPEKGIVYPHHHPRFDIDEDALSFGMETMTRTALKLLAPK